MCLHVVSEPEDNFRIKNKHFFPTAKTITDIELLYPDSGISMDEEIVLGDMIWSYYKAEL